MINVFKNKIGFTLIELVFGMFILTIGLLGIIKANLYLQRVINMNLYRNTAIEIAKYQIATLKTTDFDSVASICASNCDPFSSDPNCIIEYQIKNKKVNFGRSILIQQGANPDLKNIRITICYKIFNQIKFYTINSVLRKIE